MLSSQQLFQVMCFLLVSLLVVEGAELRWPGTLSIADVGVAQDLTAPRLGCRLVQQVSIVVSHRGRC